MQLVVGEKKSRQSGSKTSKKELKIGVLALQGDYAKHVEMLRRLGVHAVPVKLPEEIDALDGLIIPGGESTTVGKLMSRFGVDEAILRRAEAGMPVFGTCMGMILLAKKIEGSDQPCLGLMNIAVKRNAFGRQIDSFEVDLNVSELGDKSMRAVFIRAPIVTMVENSARILAKLDDGRVVLVREGNCLAASFHPELTDDIRIHEYFCSMVRDAL